MLERARGQHRWREVPPSEWLEKAAEARRLARSEHADDPARLLEIADSFEESTHLGWACMLGDEVLAHWSEEDHEHKLSLLRHGEATLAGWDEDDRTYWLFGGELFVTDNEDLDADDVRAIVLGASASAPARAETASELADDVPIVGENVSFTVSQRHRMAALAELATAETPEESFAALIVINHVVQWQMDETDAIFEAIDERDPDDPERGEAVAWMSGFIAWMDDEGRDLMELQNDLVERIGREHAQVIADTRGTPRLEAILTEKKRVLTDRYNEMRVQAGLPRVPYPEDAVEEDDEMPLPPTRGRIIDL